VVVSCDPETMTFSRADMASAPLAQPSMHRLTIASHSGLRAGAYE
jgi:hypothetical protein